MKKSLLIILLCFFVLYYNKSYAQTQTKIKGEAAERKSQYTIKTYYVVNVGWGYDIYQKGKLLIHQPHIPAVSGTKGFASEADAKKCAVFMKKKIEKNIMPPTVEIKDLDSLKIKY